MGFGDQGQVPRQIGQLSHILLGNIIASGSNSEVHYGINLLNGEPVAVKIVNKASLDPNSEQLVKREMKLLAKLKHENIVPLHARCEDDMNYYMVFPYVAEDLLHRLMSRPEPLPEAESRHIFRQILLAVKHCHDNSVAHRDLKCENVLYSQQKAKAFLCDFGLAVPVRPNKYLTSRCGSLAYNAPEIVQGKPYSPFAADMWSLGVILYCLLFRGFPFYDEDPRELVQKILSQPIFVPPHVNPSARDLLRRLLCRSPQRRITCDEALQHHWLADSNNSANCEDPMSMDS